KGTPAILAVARNITERKQAEDALQKSEEKYRNLTESFNELIYRADPETLVATYVNQPVERIYGHTVEEWLNAPNLWEQTIYPDDRERVFAEFTELQTKLESGIVEYRIIKKDKTIRWVQDHVSWEKDQQGKPISMNGIIYDISESKEADKLLRQSEEKFRTIFESANDAIYLTNLNGQFLEVNQVACDRLGYSRSELLQMGPKDIDSFDDVAQVENRINQMLQHGHLLFETITVRKDGSTIPVEVNIRLIDYMGGKAILGISRDITKHKQAVEAMLQAKMLAEDANRIKSEFIMNMSHELRTPLNSIIGFTDVICSENFGALNEYQKKYTSTVLRNGKNLLNIINDIISISNIETGKMKLHINEFFVSD
ncbi:MAG: PAS domain S-box protein, partial [Methanococcoides sp.]|nr:PAS domain S-box protein [Methanococcoides sp.]